MLKKNRFEINSQILAEAAEWFAVLGSDQVSKSEREQWQAWLASHPDHQLAWSRVEYLTHTFDDLPPKATSDTLNSPDLNRRRILKTAILGTLSLSTWELWQQEYLQQLSADYNTEIGVTRSITLTDGSQISLDTNTAINVEFTSTLRKVQLISGEIYIKTAPDNANFYRPLVVDTHQGRVLAMGTRFSVNQQSNETQVKVFEEAVEIQPSKLELNQRLTLKAGQSTDFTQLKIKPLQPIYNNQPAWTQGILLADNLRLNDFLIQLNRYRRGFVTCTPEIADIRIVGSFPINDINRILAMLEETLPIKISSPLPLWVRILPANQKKSS